MAFQYHTLRVEKLSSHGEGIAFLDGKAVFIPFTIPTEVVSAEIIENYSGYAHARLLEVLEPSPHRTSPLCPLFEICGGCALQHIEYSWQSQLKQISARETFQRIGQFDLENLPIITFEPYHYRNRTQIHATREGALGFTRAASNEVIKTPRCPILAAPLERWLTIENRKANPFKALSALIGDRPRFVVFSQSESVYIEGRDAFARAAVRGKEFVFPTGQFFQSNVGALEMLIAREIENLVGRGALDLYSGAGLFSAFLADGFESIECVESESASMEAARINLQKAKRHVHFSDISVERWITTPRAKHSFELIIADPPRSGLSPGLRSWLGNTSATTMIYISCDHASLARDLKDLRNRGWEIENISLYDFYPQTGRLEAVARLRKGV